MVINLTENSNSTEKFPINTEPRLIAPVVVYLCHESNTSNGDIIASAAGWAGKVKSKNKFENEIKFLNFQTLSKQMHIIQSQGAVIRASLHDEPTPENVQRQWHKITDMSNAKHLNTSSDAMKNLLEQLEYLGGYKNNNNGKLVSSDFNFGSRDLILYALGSESLELSLVRVIANQFHFFFFDFQLEPQ